MTPTRITGVVLIIVAVFVLVFVGFKNSARSGIPLVFSEKTMFGILWTNYKAEYLIESGGDASSTRVVDKSQNNITTSEGESYALLRSVWMDDKTTFDSSYAFMNDNLKRTNDHLYSWLFGERSDGTYGVLTDQGGYNTATDADSDTALALIFAYGRWNQDSYLSDAKNMLNDIWTEDVVIIKGVPYMTADDLEKNSDHDPIVNPSYLAPASYKIFAKVDPAHDWSGLVDSSYAVLNAAASSTLDATATDELPPDWVVISRTTGAVLPTNQSGLDTNFGFDALRAPWRVALDYQWNQDPQAKAYLDRLSFLTTQWKSKDMLDSVYGHAGNIVSAQEVPAVYGGTIGYFMVSDPADAANVYNQKLKYLFNPDTNQWRTDLSYYDSNWVWFGIGLYNSYLPNLSPF